jgi:hypothetical protein
MRQAEQPEAFIVQIGPLLNGARDDCHHLVYLDEVHIHQDADGTHSSTCYTGCAPKPQWTS